MQSIEGEITLCLMRHSRNTGAKKLIDKRSQSESNNFSLTTPNKKKRFEHLQYCSGMIRDFEHGARWKQESNGHPNFASGGKRHTIIPISEKPYLSSMRYGRTRVS